MLFMFRRIWRDFPTWERPAQIGFVLALVLLVVAFILVLVAPQTERVQFLLAFGALMLVAQGIVLWANRGMIAPITQAQRAYMRGDFEEVIAVLEPIHLVGKAEITHLTLLGNTYRQMGRLDDSKRVLSEAIDKVPNHHYSLYGFGRTLIVEGRYAEGAQFITRALDAGAPPVVRFDLAEAYHRLGRWEEARSHLDTLSRDEAHRALMADYWRYCAGEGAVPTVDVFYAGLPYWRAQAERFSETPYGQAVAEEVSQLLTLMDGEASDGKH